MKRPVTFFLDPISPYSYFACHLLSDLAKKHQLSVRCVPVLFAGLLSAHANKGPAEIPAKRRHIFLDCTRNAQLMKIPFHMPPSHPFNPLLALRTMTALIEGESDSQHHHNEKQFHFVKHVVNACWGQGMDITNASNLIHIANQCGLDGEKLLLTANEDRVKSKLRYNTDHAVELGIFGVPTVKIDEELFWGSDRMHHVEAYLEGKLQVDLAAFDKMINIPRSADRKEVKAK
jgi:2-hydroxychromene-2-carboxylate isomerase